MGKKPYIISTFSGEKGELPSARLVGSSGSGGGSVTVDAALSETSENPVRNKAITIKINEMASQLAELDTAVKYKQAATLSITDTDNNKLYRMQFKLVGGKPVIEYNEV